MHDLSEGEARSILGASRLGILSLAKDGDAYAIPLFYGVDEDAVYFHCHPGLKDEWIDGTRDACLVVIHVETEDIWESVHVFGSVEKVTLSTDLDAAKNALYQVPFPPAEGNLPHGKPVRTDQAVYYLKMAIREIDGKGSTYKEPVKA